MSCCDILSPIYIQATVNQFRSVPGIVLDFQSEGMHWSKYSIHRNEKLVSCSHSTQTECRYKSYICVGMTGSPFVTQFSFTCLNIFIQLHKGKTWLSFSSATWGWCRSVILWEVEIRLCPLKNRSCPGCSSLTFLFPLFNLQPFST